VYLYPDNWRNGLPNGLGETPVNLLACELIKRGHRLLIISLDSDIEEEKILDGPNLKICIGPFRPNHARDLFALERFHLNVVASKYECIYQDLFQQVGKNRIRKLHCKGKNQ